MLTVMTDMPGGRSSLLRVLAVFLFATPIFYACTAGSGPTTTTVQQPQAAPPPPPPPPTPRAIPPPSSAPDMPQQSTSSQLPNGSGGRPRAAPPVAIPVFPWPPPTPSAFMVLSQFDPETHPGQFRTLADVNRHLLTALDNGGYVEHSYYAVPGGFALAARLERINADGSPVSGSARWDTSFKPLNGASFSVAHYMKALFLAPPGYYRVIVFAVSNIAFSATGPAVSETAANAWVVQGDNVLPANIAKVLFTAGFACTALIYEFEKRDAGTDPTELEPSPIPAAAHLSVIKLAP